MIWIFVALALTSFALAVALFVYSGRRERAEDVQLRLRAGDDATLAAVTHIEGKIENPLLRWGCHVFWRSGFDVKPASVVAFFSVVLLLAVLIPLALGLMIGLIVDAAGMFVIWLIFSSAAARRRAKIVEQLPSYLEAAIRVLAAGNTLEEALAAAARESAEPSRTLFLSVSRQVRLGAPVDMVLVEAAEIYQIRDLRVIALAANINRRYGGTLRNVFRSLIQAIRMREAAARELKALTAETRFSAVVLAAIPVLVSAFIYVRNRPFYNEMLATSGGRTVLIMAVVLQLLGILMIWRMMKATQEDER
jgi:tight adherence protein B